MRIIKSKQFLKEYNKKIEYKHKIQVIERMSKIESLINDSENLQFLLLNPLRLIYGIEKKEGNLKEIYTAKLDSKIRLHMKPVGEYPYNNIEITEIEFLKIDDKHYGEG